LWVFLFPCFSVVLIRETAELSFDWVCPVLFGGDSLWVLCTGFVPSIGLGFGKFPTGFFTGLPYFQKAFSALSLFYVSRFDLVFPHRDFYRKTSFPKEQPSALHALFGFG
jgi:hypothetical protein